MSAIMTKPAAQKIEVGPRVDRLAVAMPFDHLPPGLRGLLAEAAKHSAGRFTCNQLADAIREKRALAWVGQVGPQIVELLLAEIATWPTGMKTLRVIGHHAFSRSAAIPARLPEMAKQLDCAAVEFLFMRDYTPGVAP